MRLRDAAAHHQLSYTHIDFIVLFAPSAIHWVPYQDECGGRSNVNREPSDFDLSAAWIRRAQGDLKAFMEGFAARLEGAVPDRVLVERRRDGLFSKTSHVVKVGVQMEPNHYSLTLDAGQFSAWRTKVVRGVALKSEQMAVPEWLAALHRDIQALAEHAGSARNVIHDFLMS
jgi:hypothetical protein